MTITKRLIAFVVIMFLIVLAVAGGYALKYFHLLPEKSYTAGDFDITVIKSPQDADGDGIDDYTDIMLGAREYLQTNPRYKSVYYEGGYPPDGEGVCTDVIWKAFDAAGYPLKELVDEDIREHTELYPGVNGSPDPNIDFRRVRNLKVFFERHALSLTTDLTDIAAWQPGDIVVLNGHIGILSDKRDKDGVPYLLHNAGQPVKEEAALRSWTMVGHYRWPETASASR